jgi:hypothetical protein
MDAKYKSGEAVIERTRPAITLIITRYDDGLYYCKPQKLDSKKELVFFERELKSLTA